MRKFCAFILILLSSLAFISSVPSYAFAASAPQCDATTHKTTDGEQCGDCKISVKGGFGYTEKDYTEQRCTDISVGGDGMFGEFIPYSANGKADTGNATDTTQENKQQATSSCGLNPFSVACISDAVLWIPGYIASYLIMPLMSLLVYLSGMILNWSMEYSVVHMHLHYGETGVDTIWVVMRDLANMGFIFALIYTAILTMFGKGEWRRTMMNMIIAALLINFSLMITKAVVDASNILAMLFYNAIVPGGTTTTTGIGSAFMQVLNLQSLYDLSSAAEGTKMAIVGAAGSVIYLISSFTFLAVAIMFIIRFVVLVFVIALSPIYAVASILPKFASYGDQWLKALLNQSFFAPVYFALTWIALKVAEGLIKNFSGTPGSPLKYSAAILGNIDKTTGVVKADPGAVGIFVMFAIIIGLLIAALSIAKGMSNKAHPMMKSITSRALGFAGGATIGLAGRAGRTAFGRVGAEIGDNERLKQLDAQGGIMGRGARLALLAGNKASTSSFDLRNVGSMGKTLGAGEVSKEAKGGYRAVLEQKIKDEEKRAKSFNTADIVQYRAEQDHTDIKAAREGDYELDEKQKTRIMREQKTDNKRAENELKRLKKNRAEYAARGASATELKEIDDHIKFAQRDLDSTGSDLETYAKNRVDKIKGFSEDDAYKEAAKAAGYKDNVKEFKKILNSTDSKDAGKRAEAESAFGTQRDRIRDSASNIRKTQYARGLEEPRILGHKFDWLDRIGFVGPTVRENVEAAIKIRKGLKEKSKEKKLAEAAAAITGDGDDGAAGATPAAGAPSATDTTPPTDSTTPSTT